MNQVRFFVSLIINILVSLFCAWIVTTMNLFPEVSDKIVFITVLIIALAFCTLFTRQIYDNKEEVHS